MPGSWEALAVAVLFVVPGFVAMSAMRVIIPFRHDSDASFVLSCMTASCLNLALWFWLPYLAHRYDLALTRPALTVAIWVFVSLIAPLLLGIGLGCLVERNVGPRFLRLIGLSFIHPIPAAWDYKFNRTGTRWVLVTLKDGTRLAGKWGPRSFASSDPRERDLYLQESYTIEQGKPWQRVEHSDGVLIAAGEIRAVEFWFAPQED